MSFIRTAVFSQPGGAAWALGHAQSLPLPGKRWWKYFQQTLDCAGQDLNQFPGAVIQVGWERLVHLHAEWMGIVFFHKEILGSVADVKPIEIDWKALGITWVWGQSPGSLVYVPIWLLPQKTTCRCPWEWESWLSQLSFLLGYQGSASIKWTSSARKMFPAIYFFSTGFMETLCLSSPGIPAGACPSFGAYQVLPSSWRGDAQTLLLKTDLH